MTAKTARAPDFLYMHVAGVTAVCPNPHGRFKALAEEGPEGRQKVWVFRDPKFMFLGDTHRLATDSQQFHGHCTGDGGWVDFRRAMERKYALSFGEDAKLHVPFTNGDGSLFLAKEHALRREDAPFLVITGWEQIIQPDVVVIFVSDSVQRLHRKIFTHGDAYPISQLVVGDRWTSSADYQRYLQTRSRRFRVVKVVPVSPRDGIHAVYVIWMPEQLMDERKQKALQIITEKDLLEEQLLASMT
ncbi:hypothetical protein HON52_00605 [Candidatus Uhrbacteria bacterium]|jgi:hypothetical protein|nr:hypothetical protein [Candidatus Uhrbacteria bacterium]